jgi:hypothetical protein
MTLSKYIVMKNEKHPIQKEDVQNSPDEGIDKDYPGFPHAPSTEQFIAPETANEKKTADTKQNNNDYDPKERKQKASMKKDISEDAEAYDDGSANAFSATESANEADLDRLEEK